MPIETNNPAWQYHSCDRCGSDFETRSVFNIRPYERNAPMIRKAFIDNEGKIQEKLMAKQEPLYLCKGCRTRIYDWINGNTRKLELAPSKTKSQQIDNVMHLND